MIEAIDYGFLISRVIHFYGFNYVEVMRLPVITFWMLHKNVDRITAERDWKSARLIVETQSGDGITALFKELQKTVGTIVRRKALTIETARITETLDRDGLNALKGLGRV